MFIHLKLWVAVARHNFKWAKICILQFRALRVQIKAFSHSHQRNKEKLNFSNGNKIKLGQSLI